MRGPKFKQERRDRPARPAPTVDDPSISWRAQLVQPTGKVLSGSQQPIIADVSAPVLLGSQQPQVGLVALDRAGREAWGDASWGVGQQSHHRRVVATFGAGQLNVGRNVYRVVVAVGDARLDAGTLIVR